MKPPSNTAPVFALAEETTWDDVDNAMAASAEYQSSKLGKIIPLFFFAPLTEPENPDAWQPMRKTALHLLIVSIARSTDVTVREALRHAAAELGAPQPVPGFVSPGMEIEIKDDGLLADVFQRMTAADLRFHAHEQTGEDDPSFYFVRGGAAVRAFDRALREVTRGPSSTP